MHFSNIMLYQNYTRLTIFFCFTYFANEILRSFYHLRNKNKLKKNMLTRLSPPTTDIQVAPSAFPSHRPRPGSARAAARAARAPRVASARARSGARARTVRADAGGWRPASARTLRDRSLRDAAASLPDHLFKYVIDVIFVIICL